MKATPDYNRYQINVSFATSAVTSVDTTITRPGLLHSMYVSAHKWPVVAAGASGASGANVVLVDEEGHTIKTFTEVLTASATLMSADVMVFPNDIIRYQITLNPAKVETRCVSGSSCIASELPTGTTVILYFY